MTSADSIADANLGKTLILFDGVCGLCHAFIHFLIRHDKRDQFRFASLQSEFGKDIVTRHGGNANIVSSVYLVQQFNTRNESVKTRGKAALYAIDTMGGAWRIIGVFRILPRFVLNFGYNLIARFRYQFWGKLESCPLPSDENRSKFIS